MSINDLLERVNGDLSLYNKPVKPLLSRIFSDARIMEVPHITDIHEEIYQRYASKCNNRLILPFSTTGFRTDGSLVIVDDIGKYQRLLLYNGDLCLAEIPFQSFDDGYHVMIAYQYGLGKNGECPLTKAINEIEIELHDVAADFFMKAAIADHMINKEKFMT